MGTPRFHLAGRWPGWQGQLIQTGAQEEEDVRRSGDFFSVWRSGKEVYKRAYGACQMWLLTLETRIRDEPRMAPYRHAFSILILRLESVASQAMPKTGDLHPKANAQFSFLKVWQLASRLQRKIKGKTNRALFSSADTPWTHAVLVVHSPKALSGWPWPQLVAGIGISALSDCLTGL